MNTFSPYKISHISLHKVFDFSIPDVKEKGEYQVFWWKDIALGQLFIEPNGLHNDKQYYEQIVQSIQPTISFYAKNQKKENAEWPIWLIQKKSEPWEKWMNELFLKWTPGEVPETVPISLIICTKDRAAFLHQCLSMIGKLSCKPAEIIVVDNNSTDDSSKAVVSQFTGVQYLREPRQGLSIARNTGVERANFPIIAFTDDDAIVHPLWLYRVWETFQDPEANAMTGLVFSHKLETEAQMIFEKFWSFNKGFIDKVFGRAFFNSTYKNGTPVWEIGAGVNMAFRKSVFSEVGNFDERLGAGASGCSEDSELWYRMLIKGLDIHYNPRAIMYHEHRSDIAGLKKQIFAYMKGHAVAALIQQEMHQESGYRKRVFQILPKNYIYAVLKGFPGYNFQLKTLGAEIKGLIAGLFFYFKNKSR